MSVYYPITYTITGTTGKKDALICIRVLDISFDTSVSFNVLSTIYSATAKLTVYTLNSELMNCQYDVSCNKTNTLDSLETNLVNGVIAKVNESYKSSDIYKNIKFSVWDGTEPYTISDLTSMVEKPL
jgi:hypothetical protein